MTVDIRLLGRVDALVDDRPLPLGGSKQRAVLAMLALRVGRTVSADELIDGLWGDRPPASAAKNVQLYVSRLRRALAGGHADTEIVTHGRSYELRLSAGAVDVLRFEQLVEEAAREPASAARANGAASAALELWRGAPLADVASEPFAAPEIGRLEELRLRAIELSIDAELAAGRHAEVIARLDELIAEEPLRERLHAQRMLALYRAGRQSEALEAYRAARETLIEQVGVEPGPELQRLQAAVLAQDPSLDAPPPLVELPVQLEGGSPLLAGRERELRWLRRRWQEAREGRVVCALVWGPAGIGKTRLVAELAAEVQRAGAAVFYAGGGEVPDAALATVAAAGKAHRPTLLVLDYAGDAPPAVLKAAAALVREPEGRPLLICVLHHDEQGPPAFAALLESGAAQRLRLDPLGEEATAEVAALYAPREGVAMPLRTLIAASEGVPLRIHRAAGEWARAEAAERLVATAGRAADDRTDLRAAQTAVAGGVVDLQTARERTRLYAVAEPPDPTEREICPFRGLAPFDAAHAEYFFGRERFVAELVARLVGTTLLAVVGPSGSGKSSAVRAGLLPALADGVVPGSERWRRAVMRPGERPLAELSRTLARAVPETGREDAAPWVADALERLPAGERLVLCVDQFEEVFVACRDEIEREAFLDALVEGAADPDERLVVVLAIRADFYGRCAEHADLSTLVSANQVLVGPMRRDELRRAIELPARRGGLRVEPRLVSALIGDVAGEPGGLPLLSAALLELWQRRDGRTLRHRAYERTGGVQGAVARLAEDAFQRLDADERRGARPMLLRLAGEDEEAEALVRRRVPLDELELDRDEPAARALAVLTQSRLLTVDEGAVEVAHEALLSEWPRLRGWLEADAEGRRLHHHLIGAAREWRDSGRDPAEFYRGARLAAALDWAAEHDPELNELEREFLDESRVASEREAERQRRANRRLRGLLAGAGILLAATVVAGVIAISERQSARSAGRAEAAQRLGTQALNEDAPDRALRLASAGFALDDSTATRSNLLTVLLRTPPAMLGVLSGTGDAPIYAVAASPDGRLLAVGDAPGTVTIFDASSRRRLGEYQLGDAPGGDPLQTLTFSPDGRTLAVTGHEPDEPETLVDLIDPRTQERRARVVLPPVADASVFTIANVAFPPAGHDLVVIQHPTDRPSVLRRVNVRTGEIEGRPLRLGPVDPSGLFPATEGERVFVTSDHNDETWEIDARTLRVVRRYPVGDEVGALSPDGSAVALGSIDGAVRLLNRRSGAVLRFTGGHQAGVLRLAFTPDGRKLVSSDDAGGVTVWDVAGAAISEELSAHRGEVYGLAVSPDGRTLYSSGTDARAILWDLSGDRRLLRSFPVYPPFGNFDTPRGLAVSPDGETLALTHKDGTVDLIDTQTLRRRASLQALTGFAAAVAFSPDASLLAVAGEGGQVTLWHARTLAPAGELRGLRANSQALAFSPDGKLLAAAENEGSHPRLRIWNVDRRALTGFRSETLAASLAFSPDGRLIAAAALEHGTEIRDASSGRLVERLPAEGLSRSVDFSPDGSLLAVGQYDGTGRLYSTESWEPVGRPLEGHAQRVTYVDFSPDGRTLATASADGTVALWDVGTQQPIGSPLTMEPNTFASVALSPVGSRLFAVSTRGNGISFDTAPEAWRRHACTIAGGGLTPDQWEEIVPEQEYVSACPSG